MRIKVNCQSAQRQLGRTTTVLLLILVAILAASYYTGYLQSISKNLVATITGQPNLPESPGRQFDVALLAGGSLDPTENLDMAYALPYDKAIRNGLIQAFGLYYTQFVLADNAENDLSIDIAISQEDTQWYVVEYNLSAGNFEEKYSLRLSNQTNQILPNLERAQVVLDEFVTKHGGEHASSDHVGLLGAEYYSSLEFGLPEVFSALESLSESFDTSAAPEHLFEASEIFSWLAISKTYHENQTLRDLLAEYSVRCYLLGRSLTQGEQDTIFTKALMLLAMGYPALAEVEFSSIKQPSGLVKTLLAYIQSRADLLVSYIKDDVVDNKLGHYLLSRVYIKLNQRILANQQFRYMVNNDPNYHYAMEFMVYEGQVGFRNHHIDRYIESLFSNHLTIIDTYLRTDWIDGDIEFLALVKQASESEESVGKWLKAHKMLLDNSKHKKNDTYLFDGDFMRMYLREEILNAMISDHDHKSRALGDRPAAQKIADSIIDAYPDNDVAVAIKIKQLIKQKQKDLLLGHVAKLNHANFNDYALKNMLEAHLIDTVLWPRYLQITALMREFNSQISPNENGLISLVDIYNVNHYKPYELQAVKRAIEVDPYDDWIYYLAGKNIEGEKLIASGLSVIDYSYGYLYRYARWLDRDGRAADAEIYYKKAIDVAPYESDAYEDLGELYRSQNKNELALQSWKKYLDTGDTSLSATVVKNYIVNLYLDEGEYEKAYDLYEKERVSGQSGALIAYAKVNEKLGDTAVAEKYFTRAAKRYPGGWAPAQLALYYWRSGNKDLAIKTLKIHKRYSGKYYYHNSVIKYFKKIDDISGAIDLLNEVENPKVQPFQFLLFAKKLVEEGFWEDAVNLMEPVIAIVYETDPEIAFYFGTYYYDLHVKKFPEAKHLALEKLMDIYGDDSLNMYFTSITFNRMGYYDEALKVANKVKKSDAKLYHAALQVMGLAWYLGRQDADVAEQLKNKISKLPKSLWHRDHVDYLLGNIDRDEILKRAYAYSPVAQCEIFHDIGMQEIDKGDRELGIKYLLAAIEAKTSNCGYRAWAFEYLENAK